MCQTFATLNSNVASLVSPLTSLIDFFSLLTICLSLSPNRCSLDQIPNSSLNLKCLSLSLHLKSNSNSQFKKKKPEMESSQTKQIFILLEKEQRNRRWRRGRAWCQGRQSHEDRRASSKQVREGEVRRRSVRHDHACRRW